MKSKIMLVTDFILSLIRFWNWPKWLSFGVTLPFLIWVGLLIPSVRVFVYIYFIGAPLGLVFCDKDVPTHFGSNLVTSCEIFLWPTTMGWVTALVFWFIVGSILGLIFSEIKRGNLLLKKILTIILLLIVLAVVCTITYRAIKEKIKEVNATVEFNLDCNDNSRISVKYVTPEFGEIYKISVKTIREEYSNKYDMFSISENASSFATKDSKVSLNEQDGQYTFTDNTNNVVILCKR